MDTEIEERLRQIMRMLTQRMIAREASDFVVLTIYPVADDGEPALAIWSTCTLEDGGEDEKRTAAIIAAAHAATLANMPTYREDFKIVDGGR